MTATWPDRARRLAQLLRGNWRAIAVACAVCAVVAGTDLFDRLRVDPGGVDPGRGDPVEMDELMFAALVFALALAASALKLRRRLLIEIEQRSREAERALSLATRDPLTGAFNRRALDACLAAPADPARRRLLLAVDVDDFKAVNDVRGHAAGDAVLVEVARRLEAIARADHGLLVRLGGDEFMLSFAVPADGAVAERIAGAVRAAFAAPVTVGNAPLHVSASIGVALAEPGSEPEQLLREADEAMYADKRRRLTLGASAAIDAVPSASPEERRRFLERALSDAPAEGAPLFVAVLAIDRFAALRVIAGAQRAARLMDGLIERVGAFDPAMRAARLTVDTLGLGLSAEDADEAGARLHQLRDRLQEAIEVDGQRLDVTLTIGLAGPGGPDAVRALTEQAQIALDTAQAQRSRFERFAPGLAGEIDAFQLMADLKAGLLRDEFWVCYQPKMRASTGAIDSLEALIRWRHPLLGQLPPDRFIGIAEQTGAIREMTFWVLERVLDERRTLLDAGHALPISVNISARLLGDEGFVAQLVALLGVPGVDIGLEITEAAVIENPAVAIRNIHALSDAGIRIAIDDYGAGMSSLSYLKQLPAHELKIDRMFVAQITDNRRDPLLVRSTIDLAHGLDMVVTAEGVDTPAALALLKAMGCDLLQGYIIAKPMRMEQTLPFLAAPPAAAVHLFSPASLFKGAACWVADGQDEGSPSEVAA